MATIYGKASDLIETLEKAIKNGEPMIDLGPQLMQTGLALMAQALALAERSINTLDRCDSMLKRLEGLSDSGDALIRVQQQVAALEKRKLELEIARLEGKPL
jgi:hypothetical protein